MSENQTQTSTTIANNFNSILQQVLGDDVYLILDQAIQQYKTQITQCSIDYSGVKEIAIKEQLEQDNQMMLVAKARSNFVEYCKSATLSIEAVLDYFNGQKINEYRQFLTEPNNENFGKMGKYGKFAHWWNFMNLGYRSSLYWEIVTILKLRDATSHRILGLNDVTEMITRFNNNPRLRDEIINFYERQDFSTCK